MIHAHLNVIGRGRSAWLARLRCLVGSAALLPSLFADGPLDANSRSTTIFIQGYSIWWGNTGAYATFSSGGGDTPYNQGANNSTYSPKETKYFNSAGTPLQDILANPPGPGAFEWGNVVATPSLSAVPAGQSNPISAPVGPGSNFTNGYLSNNDGVIAYHAQLINAMGAEVLMPDMSNEAPTFQSPLAYSSVDSQAAGGTSTPTVEISYARLLQDLDGLANQSNPVAMHVIPLIGALNEDAVAGGVDSELANEMRFAVASLTGGGGHPNRAVLYHDDTATFAPLIVIYVAIPSADAAAVVSEVKSQLGDNAFAVRYMGAYSNSRTAGWYQSSHDARSYYPPYVRLDDGLWSWIDHVYDYSSDGYATYCMDPQKPTTPEFTNVPTTSLDYVADPSSYQNDPTPFLTTRSGEQINFHMTEARVLHPKFVLLNQWNQFINSPCGYTIDGRLDIEPTFKNDGSSNVDQTLYNEMASAVADYRDFEAGTGAARLTDICVRGPVGPKQSQTALGLYYILQGSGSRNAPLRMVMKGMGPSLGNLMPGATVAQKPIFSVSSSTFAASNAGWDNSKPTLGSAYSPTYNAFYNGSPAVSAIYARAFQNSGYQVNQLNYSQTMQAAEPAITADLDPGTYDLEIDDADPAYSGGNPGPLVHARAVPMDLTSPTRIVNFSGRGWVSSGTNVIVVGFSIDAVPGLGYGTTAISSVSKSIGIFALGPSLPSYGVTAPVLENPEVVVYDGSGNVIRSWTGESTQILTLAPGSYTASISNATPGSGDGVGILTVQED